MSVRASSRLQANSIRDIVCDVGNFNASIGFAGDDEPLLRLRSVLPPPSSLHETTTFMRDGLISDFDAFGDFIGTHCNTLDDDTENKDALTEQNILMSTPPCVVHLLGSASRAQRYHDRICEILFEKLGFLGARFEPSTILALYASGRVTGCVLEVGDALSRTGCIYEGITTPDSFTATVFGGQNLTALYARIMFGGDCSRLSPHQIEVAESAKEGRPVLPDGAEFILPAAEDRRSFNSIFMSETTSFSGAATANLPAMVYNAIAKSPIDTRRELFSNIVLSGGPTLHDGFTDDFSTEITNIRQGKASCLHKCEVSHSSVPHTSRMLLGHHQVKVVSPPERIVYPWIGGSIWASLSFCNTHWMDRADWLEG